MIRHTTVGSAMVFATWVLLVSPVAHADDLAKSFQRANEAFGARDYLQAIAGYERIIRAGTVDASVAVNLGNAFARNGELGKALRWYELATRLSPNDADARRGFQTVFAALGKTRAEREGGSAVLTRRPLGEALVAPFSETILASTLLVANLMLWLSLGVWAYGSRKAKTAALFALAATLLTGGGLCLKRDLFSPGEPALVTAREGILREAPDPRATVIDSLAEGDRVWMRNLRRPYREVVLENGRRGWMKEDALGSLRNP